MRSVISMVILVLCFGALPSKTLGVDPVAEVGRTSRLAQVFERAQRQEPITIAYFGGSITWGAAATDPLKTSWRALTMQALKQRYPHTAINFIDAAIGGHSSILGVFRMDRDVLPYKPDLIFLEYTMNDGIFPETDQSYEGIIRKVQTHLPQTAIVSVLIGGVNKQNHYVNDGHERELAIANHYGLPVVDIITLVRQLAVQGLNLSSLVTDGVHPSDTGHALYAKLVLEGLDQLIAHHADLPNRCPAPLTPNRYEGAAMLELSKLDLPEGWTGGTPSVVGTWFDHTPSRWMNSVVRPTAVGATLPIRLPTDVTVTGLGLYYEQLPGGEPIEIVADSTVHLAADKRNNLNFARVNYAFGWISKPPVNLELRAPKGGPAAAAYLLYTTDLAAQQP